MTIGTGLRTLTILLAASGVAGCAGSKSFVSAPAVSLTSVKLASASLSRQTFHLGFDVDNPNPFPLPVKAVEYRVTLDKERFAGGETIGKFTVPARGQDAFMISVDLDLLGSASRLASFFRAAMPAKVSYELQGHLAVDIPFTDPIPFSSSGFIELQGSLF